MDTHWFNWSCRLLSSNRKGKVSNTISIRPPCSLRFRFLPLPTTSWTQILLRYCTELIAYQLMDLRQDAKCSSPPHGLNITQILHLINGLPTHVPEMRCKVLITPHGLNTLILHWMNCLTSSWTWEEIQRTGNQQRLGQFCQGHKLVCCLHCSLLLRQTHWSLPSAWLPTANFCALLPQLQVIKVNTFLIGSLQQQQQQSQQQLNTFCTFYTTKYFLKCTLYQR